MTSPNNLRSRRWVELAAGAVLVAAALEEAAYLLHRMSREARAWWEDVEHRDHYGMERSTLDFLVPRIMSRRFRA